MIRIKYEFTYDKLIFLYIMTKRFDGKEKKKTERKKRTILEGNTKIFIMLYILLITIFNCRLLKVTHICFIFP